MSTYILWDIDGTLIYNTPSAGALYIEAIEQVTGVRPTVPVADPHGMTEGQLLLAPSHYAHRTIPSKIDRHRISFAFDVVPHVGS